MARPTISRKPRIIDGFSEKQSAALFALFARNDDTLQQLAQLDASARIFTTDTVARAGQFLRASPPDSRGMAVLLPSPDSTQPGDTISVSLEGPLGDLRVSCVPNQGGGARVTLGTVNGQDRATFTTAGLIVFTSNGATGWTTAAEHPAESAAAPSITPTSSTEILPSNPSGSIWTWALRPFSVVLGRLAKQVGLSVIGTASDALAGLDAITATAARQALLVNSTGTAIGWRALEGADLPATSPYGWDDVLATDANSGAHTPVINTGQALNFDTGATGITADGDLTAACVGAFTLTATDAHIHPTGALHVGHEGSTASIHQGCVGTWEGVCADFSLQAGSTVAVSAGTSITLSTAASNRVILDNAGAVQIVSGNFLQCGSAGPTTSSPQIRSGDVTFRIHGSNFVELAATGASSGQVRITGAATGTNVAHTWLLGGVARLTVLGNGEWSTPAGATNQYWKWQSGAFPIWSSLALSDLPSQSADTFLGRLAGAGTPTAQLLSDIDSTSIIYDATSHTFQRAALTGDVTASQNSNATTIANDAVTNAKLANMAQATIKLRASGAGTGDPTDGTISQALDMASSTNGAMLARSAASGNTWTIVPNQANGRHLFTDGSGVATWGDPTTGSSGTLSLSSTGSLSVVTDADRDLVTSGGNGVGFSKSISRCEFWEDFTCVPSSAAIVGSPSLLPCDTGWILEATGSNGSVQALDAGASGDSNGFGHIELITGATNGSTVRLYKGSAQTTRWGRMDNVKSLKFKLSTPSAANIYWAVGFADVIYGGGDAAYFYFDTSVDTTIHCFSANSGGATSNDTDSNIAPGTGGRIYEIRCPTDTTKWEFYIDGTLVATQTTTAKNRGCNLSIMAGTRTAASKTTRVDYISFESQPTR